MSPVGGGPVGASGFTILIGSPVPISWMPAVEPKLADPMATDVADNVEVVSNSMVPSDPLSACAPVLPRIAALISTPSVIGFGGIDMAPAIRPPVFRPLKFNWFVSNLSWMLNPVCP